MYYTAEPQYLELDILNTMDIVKWFGSLNHLFSKWANLEISESFWSFQGVWVNIFKDLTVYINERTVINVKFWQYHTKCVLEVLGMGVSLSPSAILEFYINQFLDHVLVKPVASPPFSGICHLTINKRFISKLIYFSIFADPI